MDYDLGKQLEALNAKLDYVVAWIQSVEGEAKKNIEEKPAVRRGEPEPEEPPEQPEEFAEEPQEKDPVAIPAENLEQKAKEEMNKMPTPDMAKVEKKLEKKYSRWRRP